MNFVHIVSEVLLLEDPDSAKHGNLHLTFNTKTARPFFVLDVRFKADKLVEQAMFYATASFQIHTDLFDNMKYMDYTKYSIQNNTDEIGGDESIFGPPVFDSCPAEVKEKMYSLFKEWDGRGTPPYKAEDFKKSKKMAGRYWLEKDKFFISVWRGSDQEIKKWLKLCVPIWNPEGLPFFYQPVGVEDDVWIDGNEFMNSHTDDSQINSPEISKIETEINKLLPLVHIKSGSEKQSIKFKIKSLQSKIKELGGTPKSIEDDGSAKGSYKQSRIAGPMSIAKMNALRQTSESVC